MVLCQGSCQEREGPPSSWFHSKIFRLDASPGDPEGHSGQPGGGWAPRGSDGTGSQAYIVLTLVPMG